MLIMLSLLLGGFGGPFGFGAPFGLDGFGGPFGRFALEEVVE